MNLKGLLAIIFGAMIVFVIAIAGWLDWMVATTFFVCIILAGIAILVIAMDIDWPRALAVGVGLILIVCGVGAYIDYNNDDDGQTKTRNTTSSGATYVSSSASCSERTIVVPSTTSGSGAGGGWTTPIDAGGTAEWRFTMDDTYKQHVWVRVDGGEPKLAATESPPIVGKSVSLQNRGNNPATVTVTCTPR